MNSPESTHHFSDLDHPVLFDMPESDVERERTYDLLQDPELRYKYVAFTEGLIASAIEKDIDTFIFLDKSARPVAWLMKNLWPTLGFSHFDENDNPVPVKMPDIKFVNIDREQWAAVMGRSEVKEGRGISMDGVHKDTIDSLTGLFAVKNMDAKDYVSSDSPTLFDNKNLMIVDEVSASGDTLAMASALFERAFENANVVTGTHWMTPERVLDKKSGGMRNVDLPIWYDSATVLGRLVGDRDLYGSGHSVSVRQRRGALFLSSRFSTPDTKGLKLRKEMEQLGADVAEGKMPVRINGAHRPDDDRFVELFMKHVNGLSIKEFAELRRVSEREHVAFPNLVSKYKSERPSSHQVSE